jgi:hypothetical protein
MDEFLGAGNGLLEYLVVLLTYAGLFVVVWQIQPRLEPAHRKTFYILIPVLGVIATVANYVLFLMGVMSFMPWLNNFIHTFIWIGVVLGFTFLSVYQRPIWQQLVIFAVLSFVVKTMEHQVLSTWEMDNFFGIRWESAYMFGWSFADGFLIPLGLRYGLRLVSRYIPDLLVP